jgi:polyhydroxyalkanoate synthesis regulator phasin
MTMTEESKKDGTGEANGEPEDGGSDGRGRMGDGIRSGLGVLTAFKDALEETIQEARDRGDLSTERAKEVMKETLEKAQSAAEGAKEKLDFAHQGEMEAVRRAVDSIKDRLSALEVSVFGAAREGEGAESPPGDEKSNGGGAES